MIAALKGYKTYIIAALMVLIGVENVIAGDATLTQLLHSPDLFLILNGLGLSALRAGISKVAV